MAFLEVKNLTVEYNGYRALEDVSFKVDKAKIVTLIGPNGAGKTTLLRAIAGLIKPVKGVIRVMGISLWEDPIRVRKLMGYVPQWERINIGVPLKVKDVVLMGRLIKRKPLRIPIREDIEAAKDALRLVGLEDAWNKPFTSLSGGQQQRVLIARCCATEAKLMLLDEPFSAVDTRSLQSLLELIDRARSEYGITVLLATHDVNPVLEYTDLVMILNRRLVSFGPPDIAITEEALKTVYGPVAKVIRHGKICYTVSGDVHA